MGMGAGAGRRARPAGRSRGSPGRARRRDLAAALAGEALERAAGTRPDARPRQRLEPARPAHRAREPPQEHARRAALHAARRGFPRGADQALALGSDLHRPHQRLRAPRLQGGIVRGSGRRQPAHRARLRGPPRPTRRRRLRRRRRKDPRARIGDAQQGAVGGQRSRRAPARRATAAGAPRGRAQLGSARRAGIDRRAHRRPARASGRGPGRCALFRPGRLAAQPGRALAPGRAGGRFLPAAAEMDPRAVRAPGEAGRPAGLRHLLDQPGRERGRASSFPRRASGVRAGTGIAGIRRTGHGRRDPTPATSPRHGRVLHRGLPARPFRALRR
jgi:hypothetical protein